MLTKWGVELADRMGLPVSVPFRERKTELRDYLQAVVESTMNAVAVYEKNGFKGVKEIDFKYSDKFAEKPKPHLLFMHRAAQ